MFVSILYKFNIYIYTYFGKELNFYSYLVVKCPEVFFSRCPADLRNEPLHKTWPDVTSTGGDLQGSPRTAVDMQILEAQKLLGWFQSLFFRCFWFWVDCESSPKLDRWKLMEHHEEVKSPSRKLRDDHQLFVQQPGLRPLVEVIRPKKPKSGLP